MLGAQESAERMTKHWAVPWSDSTYQPPALEKAYELALTETLDLGLAMWDCIEAASAYAFV